MTRKPMSKQRQRAVKAHSVAPAKPLTPDQDRPDWTRECEVCGATPVHPVSGMCGPCSFGEASTAGGNW